MAICNADGHFFILKNYLLENWTRPCTWIEPSLLSYFLQFCNKKERLLPQTVMLHES